MDKQLAFKRKGKTGDIHRIAGMTKDGVTILKSPGRATHFTDKEMSDAVRAALAGRANRSRGVAAEKSVSSKKG